MVNITTSLLRSTILIALTCSANAALLAHWTFDEGSGTTAADSSGNGLTATTTASTTWVTGVSGTAANLPKFTISDSSSLAFTGGQAFTISLWAKPSANDDYAILAGFEGTGANGDRYGIKINRDVGLGNGQVTATQGNGPRVIATNTIEGFSGPGDDWVHIVVVNDPLANAGAGASYLYVNGSENASAGLINIPNSVDAQWTMGTYYNSNGYDFSGALDDVQVYDDALSAAQVSTLFSNPGSAIPEPSSLLLLCVSGLVFLRRRR